MNTPTPLVTPQAGPFSEKEVGGESVHLVWASQPTNSDVSGRVEARLGMFQSEQFPLLAKLLSFETQNGMARLVMEQPGGQALRKYIGPTGLDTSAFLQIALQICEAVQLLHSRRIAHGHICPGAVFVDGEQKNLRLALHPDCLTTAAERLAGIDNWGIAELAYCAPEQTQRTEAVADLRSDLYALGTVFFEMLTGTPAFHAADQLELIHKQLAVAPEQVADLRPEVPRMLSRVVRKLLEKSPEHRYQSVYGLLIDLRYCQESLSTNGSIPFFDLAEKDVQATFQVPDKLYGRDAELETLESLVQRITDGQLEVGMVRGRSGFGKSAIVEKLRHMGRADNLPIFISGKYERMQNLPYLGLLNALREFILQKVAQGGSELEEFQLSLLERLDENLGVVVDFLPELKHLVGEIEQAPTQDAMERNQRFRIAMQAFFEMLSGPGNPVILFLDDLQWADSGSVALLEDVLLSASLSNLLVVGAYRDNEVGPNHRVTRLVEALTDAELQVKVVDINALDVHDTRQMISDALHLKTPDDVAELAAVVHGKTQGNAFHLRRLLTALYQEGAIRFDTETGSWNWGMDTVTKRVIDVDVAQLMTERIERLSEKAKDALRFAACFGTTFTARSLMVVSDQSQEELNINLRDSVAEGFILPSGRGDAEGVFSFGHDMVRDAAYLLTGEDEREKLHYKIGAYLVGDISDPENDDRLFAAMDQIVLGKAMLTDPELGRQVTRYALAAARRAKSVAAYDIAQRYLGVTAELPADIAGVGWEREPTITEELRLETLEITFMLDGFDAARPIFDELMQHLPDNQKKAHVYQLLVTLYTFRSEYAKALELGIEGLKLLGVNLSGPYGPKIMAQLAATQIELRKHDIYDFSQLPEMDNPVSEQLIEMLMIVSTPAFLQNKDLFVLISLRMFRITLRDGLTSVGVNSIQNYAIVMYLAFKASEKAHNIGINLFPVLESRNVSSQVRGRFTYTYSIVIAWQFRSYEDLREIVRDGIKHSWAAVDLEYVGYFYYGALKYTWLMCAPLGELSDQLDEFERYQKRLRHEVFDSISAVYRLATDRLTDVSGTGLWSEKDKQLEQTMVGEASVGSFLTAELLLTHVFSDWAVVGDLYKKLRAEEGFTTLGPEYVDYHLLSGLCLTRVPGSVLNLSAGKVKRRLKKHLSVLKRLAEKFPINHRFQYALLHAEILRSKGQADDALPLFDEAIAKAQDSAIWSYAGIASECAALAAETAGDLKARDAYLKSACKFYFNWGATNKVRVFEAAWPDVFTETEARTLPVANAGLDLSTIIKASQAILEVTDLDTLLKRLMQIAMENAGADSGSLYLVQDDGLRLAATARMQGATPEVDVQPEGDALERLDPNVYPREIVSAVAATMEAVILSDATSSPRYGRLRYVRRNDPKSMMSLPVVSSGTLKAVLHLENSLGTGVFTADRQEILSTLVSLAAISLTNAMLYARQDEALRVEKHASEELIRINKLKDEFLANTSHELRTPLSGIIGLADGMIGGANGNLPAEAADTLSLIVSSGRRLSGLVNDILDFSRMRDGELDLQSRPVDLHALVGVVFALLSARAQEHKVTLQNDVPKEGCNVLGDENRLQQIFLNLVDNGIKFATGGTVRVEMTTKDGRTYASVVDDGDGVPQEAQDRIFQSFEQADSSIQRAHGGVGLGLAISRGLVELHGGAISLASRPGEGARFTFDLQTTGEAVEEVSEVPVAQLQPLSIVPASLHTADKSHREPDLFAPGDFDRVEGGAIVDINKQSTQEEQTYRALIVDDDPVNLQVLKNYMRLEGFSVLLAHNGQEAINFIEQGYEPDIVLLDVMMPRMSGYEVCAKIRETHPAARLPVVMLTAKNQIEDLRAGFDSGASDYLAKPFSREELSARMRSQIELTRVSTAYERFVPTEYMDFLKRDGILDLNLGDNVAQKMSIMFTDIRAFTTLVEELSPAESFEFLREYFSRMGPVVQENSGVVSQYLGDGMMSLFPGAVEESVKAAVGIQSELRKFNVDRAARDLKPVGTGIGIHTGDVIVGILGDKYRRNGNVVSDSVNLAARLEGLSAQYGIRIAVSEEIIKALDDPDRYPHRKLEMVRVVGKKNPVTVYEVFAADEPESIALKQKTRSSFEAASDAFRQGNFEIALKAYKDVLSINPEDAAARRMADRAERFVNEGLPSDWIGVEVLQRK